MSKKDLLIKTWVCGPLAVNCYLVGSLEEKRVALIDPGGCIQEITRFLDERGLTPDLIIATHGHLDHIMAIPYFKEKWNVKVACHIEEIQYFVNPDPMMEGFFGQSYKPFKPEYHIKDGDKIYIGPYIMEVIHTPGHTPGSICILCPPFIISGDTLFKAGIGRTDFPGGDYKTLMGSLRNRLWVLPNELILLPGHGETSTLGEEKKMAFMF